MMHVNSINPVVQVSPVTNFYGPETAHVLLQYLRYMVMFPVLEGP